MSEFDPSQVPDRLPQSFKERRERFAELRRRAIEITERQTAERIRTDPIPTPVEDDLGAFVEMLEPQVREAVLLLHERGYTTESSGFGGSKDPGLQKMTLHSNYSIDNKTREQLAAMGYG